MTIRTDIAVALNAHVKQGSELLVAFLKAKRGRKVDFHVEYQNWYSKALPFVKSLAQDRYEEFRRYYEPHAKRKSLGYGDYVIQDFLKGVAPSKLDYPDFDPRAQVGLAFLNQITILGSIRARLDSALSNLEDMLFADLGDAELATARALQKVSPRAAGALAGVVLETHLQRVTRTRGVMVAKKAPTIGDLNDPLKVAGVYDTATWRKIAYLGDIRNLCSHKKADDPTHEQVIELIEGVEWIMKNVG